MDIVTKKGDGGSTYLAGGSKVPKDHARIEACGDIDELCSFLGMSKSLLADKRARRVIESVQRDLFALGAEVASMPRDSKRLKYRIGDDRVRGLEKALESFKEKGLSGSRSFVIPGQDFASSALDVARSVARRAERRMVSLDRKNALKNKNIIRYLNRLSDLLYVLARFNEKSHNEL